MNSNFWDNIGRTVTGAADTVGRKATEVAGVAKLKNQIYSLERDMKRDYEAIGKIVYERYAAAGSLEELTADGKSLEEVFLELTDGEPEEATGEEDAE